MSASSSSLAQGQSVLRNQFEQISRITDLSALDTWEAQLRTTVQQQQQHLAFAEHNMWHYTRAELYKDVNDNWNLIGAIIERKQVLVSEAEEKLYQELIEKGILTPAQPREDIQQVAERASGSGSRPKRRKTPPPEKPRVLRDLMPKQD